MLSSDQERLGGTLAQDDEPHDIVDSYGSVYPILIGLILWLGVGLAIMNT